VSTVSGVAIAEVSDVNDPLQQGRVLVTLPPSIAGVEEWARVVSAPVGPSPAGLQLALGDQVLVAFEEVMQQGPSYRKDMEWRQSCAGIRGSASGTSADRRCFAFYFRRLRDYSRLRCDRRSAEANGHMACLHGMLAESHDIAEAAHRCD